jgi:glycosyltransferase involved in cell wall biosynthesis
MGRPLKIGLHSPFFGSTLGGGEKYLGGAAEVIRDAYPEHSVEIVSPAPVDRVQYTDMLGLDLHDIKLREPKPGAIGSMSMLRRLNQVNALRRVRNLALAGQALRESRRFDLFISMAYVIPAVSRARRSLVICQFPYQLSGAGGRLLWRREMERFDAVVCYSEYVRGWISTYWGRDATVVNPPIDFPAAEPDWDDKQPTILSVGRFFAAGHNKRQDLMVRAFREMVDGGLQGWKLVLAGSVHSDAVNAGYYESVVELARGYPVEIHPGPAQEKIRALYDEASIYWHAAGSGVDAATRPIDVEHFGMTTAEAMGHGAVPLAFNGGGQPEVVSDGVNGYLWQSLDELSSRTLELTRDPARRRRLGEEARFASRRFDRATFRRGIVAAVEPLVRDLETGSATAGGPAGTGSSSSAKRHP